MAGRSAGELWFEMGVRDNVASAMEKDIALSKKLKGSIDEVMNSYKDLSKKEKKEVDSMVSSADRYRHALTKINEIRSKLKETKARASVLGIDTKELDTAMRKLNGFNGRYVAMANMFGADSARMHSMLGAQFNHRMTWMNSIISKYNQLINVEQKEGVAAIQAQVKANQSLMASYDKVTRSTRQTMSTLSMLRQQAGYYFSLFGAQTLLRNIITIGGQFEFQHVALQNIIGDAEKATTLFAQLKTLAVESPKTFMELTTSAKQLSAYQIPVNELFDTTKRLSDLSVGLGVDMNRLILAYGQVRSAAVLRGQELRQFTEAGIPLVQALADKFTKLNGKITTTADVFKLIQTRAVPFEMVKEVLWDMTNQGGQFYNMQAVMADTLYGKWQKLQDIWQITLGEIADANSLSGKFFKTALDGIIFLARNLQALAPLLSTFMLFKGASSIGGRLGLTHNIDYNIEKAQKLRQIELQRQFINREITKEEYKQQLAINGSRERYYLLLASEGRLNQLQMRRLLTSKRLTEEKLQELVAAGKLEMREAALIRLQQRRLRNNMGLDIQTIGGGIGNSLWNFMGGWVGMAFAGVGAAVSAWSAYSKRLDEIEEKAKAMESSAKERAKTLQDSYKAIEKRATPTDKSELQHQVEAMKELLKNEDLYTESIDKSVTSATSLTEKYEILKTSIKEAAEMQSMMADYTKMAQEAVKNSGFIIGNRITESGELNGVQVGNERIDTNMQQYEEAYNKYLTLVSSLGDTRERIEAEIAKIGGAVGASLDGKELEEKIRILQESGAWDGIIARIGETDSEFASHLKKIGGYADDVNEKWTEIAEDDVPRIVQTIKKWIPVTGEENIKKWAKSNETLVQAMINAIAKMISISAPKIRQAFINAIRGVFGLPGKGVDGNVVDNGTPYTRQSIGSKNLIHNIVKAYGNGITSVKEMAQWIGDTSNEKTYEEAFEGIKKARDAAKKTYNAAKAAKKDASKEKAEYERLDKIFKGSGAEAYFTSQDADKKKGKGGSKTDEVAKDMRERVSVLKDAYSEYKKWSELLGKEGALAKVRESGIFSSLFADKDFKGLDDYKGELQRIKDKLSPEKTEQRKVIESIDKILLGMDYDDAKERAKKAVELMRSSMGEIGRHWDLYKSLYEKTGDKEFASLAFSDNVVWDDKTRAMASELSSRANLGVIDFTMSEESAKDFFKYNTTEGEALYEQWKQIKDLIRNNYKDALIETADAIASLMTEEEKIAQIEQKIADLRKNGAAENDPRILKLRKEEATLQQQAFEKSVDYLRFYNSILSMTIPEAEKIGQKIRRNLNKELADGTITAKEYVRQVKLITEQLSKLKNKQSELSSFLTGGLQGLFQNRYDTAESKFNDYATQYAQAANDYAKAVQKGNEAGKQNAENAMNASESMMKGAGAAMEGAQGAMNTMAIIDRIVHGINDTVQGIKGAFDDIKETYEALGKDTNTSGWQEAGTFLNAFSSASQSATNAWDSLKNGNIGGVVQGVVGSFTGWIKGFAKGWDNKMDNQIRIAQEQLNATERLRDSIEKSLERTLGSVYEYSQSDETGKLLKEAIERTERVDEKTYGERARSSLKSGALGSVIGGIAGPIGAVVGGVIGNIIGAKTKKYTVNYYQDDTIKAMQEALESQTYFDEQYALLYKERDELRHQLEAEQGKKNEDNEKIEDYKASIAEVEDKIKNFAADMAKALYNIDVKSWASELSDAVVSAWQKGEDAAQAWHDKVKDLVADISKNIVSQKIVEKALEPVLSFIEQEMTSKNGKLDEASIVQLAQKLEEAGNVAIPSVEAFLEAMKQAGYDLGSGGSGGSSSVSQVLSGLSENDQGLLMSYINAIRGDVSIIRMHWDELYAAIAAFPAMGAVAQMQLQQLEAIAANTLRNADSAAVIEGFCRRLELGEAQIRVK